MKDDADDFSGSTLGAIAGAFETVRRKVVRSLETRGVRATVARGVLRSGRWLATRPTDLMERRRERAFDREHGVDTRRESDPGWMSRIESPNWRHGTGYEPARTDEVRTALRSLAIEPSSFTLIDYGCGKGKVLLLASHFGFHRIVGVEYDPRLAAIAAENVRDYDAEERRTKEIEVRCADAVDVALPVEPLVLFFHHPFEAPVFERVVERVRASLATHPREMWVVYVDPRCARLFEDEGFRRVARPTEGSLVLARRPELGVA